MTEQHLISTSRHFLRCNCAVVVASLLALMSLSGCAGYQIGSATMFRADVRTVHVPMIESNSFRRFLGERLTEAVVKEIESRSIYKVSTFDQADTILRARILSDRKRVLSESINDDARNLEEEMLVEFSWTDRLGRTMMQRPGMRINFSTSYIPEAGQSITTAQQESIDRIARQIVNQMEVAW